MNSKVKVIGLVSAGIIAGTLVGIKVVKTIKSRKNK